MKNLLIILFFSSSFFSFAQRDSLQLGEWYAEDQIYATVFYEQLFNQPTGITKSGFSYGFSAGYFKDIILNKQGSFAVAFGVGYGYDNFNHGFKLSEVNNNTIVEIAPFGVTNTLTLHNIEFPFEIRWRTSTAIKYNFWRIYSGIKFTYTYANKFDYNGTSFTNISRFNKWQYGLTLSAGYDAFNIQLYYGLTPLLNDASLGKQKIHSKILRVGFIFYIL